MTLLLYFFAQCSTLIPVAIPRYPAKNGPRLREVLEGQRNLAVVAAKARAQEKLDKKEKPDKKEGSKWDETIEAAVSKNLAELGYYNVIDLSSRKKRLQELAHSQSGITQESLEIGRDIQAKLFLVIRMTRPPESRCKIEEVADYFTTAMAVTARAIVNHRNAGNVHTGRRTGVLYVSVFAEGKLINIETGLSTSQFFSKTLRVPSAPGNRVCTSPNKAFDKIFQRAGKSIAQALSPKMNKLDIPLMQESPDLPSPVQKKTNPHLLGGVKWAESGEMEEARTAWEEALKQSKNKSGAAMWNLGVYHWHVSDMDHAAKYFEQFKKKKPQLLDPKKRRIIGRFNKDARGKR